MGMQQSHRSSENITKSVYIPGKNEIIREIRTINDQLKGVEDEIKKCMGRIHEIIKQEKENSPRNTVLNQLNDLKSEVKVFREEKRLCLEEIEKNKKSIDEIRETLGSESLYYVNNEDTIDQKMKDLNMRLIKESLSAPEEKKIANELASLKAKKSRMGDMKESLKVLKSLDQEQGNKDESKQNQQGNL